ncbi:MAG TPA: hypothetical protein DCW52_00310 [Gammaproteobacteria bacterium]|nr:hypothetical protein [Gammaproteobacteria bacterium]
MLPLIGSLIGAGVGLYNSNKSSQAANQATENQMAAFNQYQPYVDAGLSGGADNFGNVLNTGAYQGDTYAGPNASQLALQQAMQANGTALANQGYKNTYNNNQFGLNSNNLYEQNVGLAGTSQNLYNQGAGLYGQNQDLYNQNAGLYNQFQNMSEAAKADRLSNANAYAAANANPLAEAAMAGDRRNLEENTLTGIEMGATGTGNLNSSRAGVQAAIANRGYNDRLANATIGIQDRLVDRSLASQARQFSDQNNALVNAGNTTGAMGSNLAGAGNALNAQAGLLNNTGGHLSNAGVANTGIRNAYQTGVDTMRAGGTMGTNAGNQLQGYNQAALNNDRMTFERNRDFGYNQYKDYMGNFLNKAPATSGATYEPNNYNNPLMAGMFGAQTGFGFPNSELGQQIGSYFS